MADDEQFSLCWNNFNSNLSAGFHESLCRGDLVDVTLAAEGQFVKAHRLVLSVCSPYFRKMFTQMPANQHAFVFLKDVSHSALKDLIQFMYCGEVNVKQEALPAFISTAEALQIKGLTDSDPAPSQSPAKPSTPAPQPAPPAQTIAQTLTSPRIRQRSSTSRSYRIETDDSDDKTTQIVLQATAVQQQSQPSLVQQTSASTSVVNQKRSAARSISAPHTKRVKNSADPLEASEPTQISVQTVTESKSTSEAEFIDLPIEMPTKSEPDYAEEGGEVETAEHDTTYVEDDSYGDMKYDENYFTENEEVGNASGGAGGATTSTAVVKQSFVDASSYVEQSDQPASEAQGKRAIVKRSRPKRAPVSTQTLAEKISKALKKDGQNAVFVSTTKGGMKILFEGHHFKYMFRRGPSSIFQCCYQESNEQCVARVVVNQNRVYPLDGEHHHFNQALDKSVTSLMFEATSEDFECSTRNKPAVPGVVTKSESDQFAEDVMQLSEDGTDMEIIIPDPKPSTRNDQNRVVVLANQEITPKLIDKNILTADVFREKIKKRLQKALLGKKKE